MVFWALRWLFSKTNSFLGTNPKFHQCCGRLFCRPWRIIIFGWLRKVGTSLSWVYRAERRLCSGIIFWRKKHLPFKKSRTFHSPLVDIGVSHDKCGEEDGPLGSPASLPQRQMNRKLLVNDIKIETFTFMCGTDEYVFCFALSRSLS